MKKVVFLVLFSSLLFFSCGKDVEIVEDSSLSNDIIKDEPQEILDDLDLEFETELAKIEEAEREEAERKKIEEDYNTVVNLEELEEDKKIGKGARGSCNASVESSTCIEYYGSFWTEIQMKYSCSTSGVFSTEPCPGNRVGGCNTGAGTDIDSVAWIYLGANEMTAESIKYAAMACNASGISRWINIK